jgi:pyridoxamine 5'-phosphate oxidase
MPQWHDKQAKSLTQINRVSSQIPKMESKGSAADALAANRGPQTMPNNQALYQEALLQLQHLIDAAAERGIAEPHAAALATADTRARPSVRTVHIVAVEEDGLLFFASLQSGKGQQLLENPRAGLCFFWPELQEQVIVEGTVLLQSAATSDSYWQRRAREAQLSAWVSRQGSPAPTKKDALHQQARQLEQTLGFEPLQRNALWHAFRIQPERIEFWPSGWQRMRERVRYSKSSDGQWSRQSVNP